MGVVDSHQAKDSGKHILAVGSTTSSLRIGKLELDRGLARLCGFDINEQRLVSEGYRVLAAKRPRREN